MVKQNQTKITDYHTAYLDGKHGSIAFIKDKNNNKLVFWYRDVAISNNDPKLFEEFKRGWNENIVKQ